ncbi:MAG: amidohydrolase [Eudoraea sp.]|nr:amidohydrolase [Eudoraea sp.]
MKELHIALVQTPLVWEDPQTNRKLLSDKLEALKEEVDLIILPEMFTTGFTMAPETIPAEEGPISLNWMKVQAKKHNAGIMGSIVYTDEGKHFNRLFLATPEGAVGQYDKRHTFTLAGEDRKYQAGSEKLFFDFKGFRICPLICYDLRFPVWSRNTEDYDLLVYVANWPEPRIDAWDALLKARAIENMAYCVGVNRVGADLNGHQYPGHSAVYDCLGNRVAFSREETTVHATINKAHLKRNREKLQFLADRDSFSIEQ